MQGGRYARCERTAPPADDCPYFPVEKAHLAAQMNRRGGWSAAGSALTRKYLLSHALFLFELFRALCVLPDNHHLLSLSAIF